MVSAATNPSQSEVVVAYFSNAADAQRALDDLQAEGFEPRQMGAAFHSRSAVAGTATGTSELDEVGSSTVHASIDSNTTGAGAASDDRDVTPLGLASGGGKVFSGAGRPGPIPGGEIPHHHRSGPIGTRTVNDPLPATGGFHEEHDESWWDKVKHFFGGGKPAEGERRGVASESSLNFGTGEGHLATYPENYEYSYSGSAFEGAFTAMGLNQAHAHSLAGDLNRGGAVVTVNAAGRAYAAEQILERNHGRIRYESAAGEAAQWSDIPGARVRVYGEMSHTYPRHLPESATEARKAS